MRKTIFLVAVIYAMGMFLPASVLAAAEAGEILKYEQSGKLAEKKTK